MIKATEDLKLKAKEALDFLSSKASDIRANPNAYINQMNAFKENFQNNPDEVLEQAGIKSMMNPSFSNMPVGVGLIVAGLFLAFMGRRIFKAFLATSGAIVGGSVLLGLLVLVEARTQIVAPVWLFWVFGLVGAFTGSTLFVKAWKWAVYAMSAYGGVMFAIWLLGVINGFEFAQHINRNIFLAVWGVIGLFMAHFVDEFVVIFSSSMIGAFSTVIGYDLIFCVGFRVFIKNTIDNTPDNLVNHILEQTQLLNNIRYCMLAILFIASAGIYTQYRHQPRSYDRD
jgi:hypothetical protein